MRKPDLFTAKALSDEYVSVEYLFLAMIKHPNRAVKELLKEFGITRERFSFPKTSISRQPSDKEKLQKRQNI